MRTSRLNYVIVGAFVVCAIAGILVIAAIMSGRTGDTEIYYTHYDNVGGLDYGTKVLFEGFPIGQVDDITPDHADGRLRFKVALALRADWPVPSDSTAMVAASGLLAAVTIDIRSSGRADTLIEPGGIIPGSQSGNVFGAINDMAAQVSDLSESSIKPLLNELRTLVGTVNQSVGTDLPVILSNVRQASEAISTQLPQILDRTDTFTRRLNEEVLSQQNTAALNTSVQELTAFTADLAELGASLGNSADDLNRVMGSVETLVNRNSPVVDASLKDLRFTLRTLSRSTETITYNLETTVRNFNEFSRALRQNPGILLRSGGEDTE